MYSFRDSRLIENDLMERNSNKGELIYGEAIELVGGSMDRRHIDGVGCN